MYDRTRWLTMKNEAENQIPTRTHFATLSLGKRTRPDGASGRVFRESSRSAQCVPLLHWSPFHGYEMASSVPNQRFGINEKECILNQRGPIHSQFLRPFPPLGVAEIGKDLWTRDTSSTARFAERNGSRLILLGCLLFGSGCIDADSPCQRWCREGNWKLHEVQLLSADTVHGNESGQFDVVVPTGVERARLALTAAGALTLGAGVVIAESTMNRWATVAGMRSVTIDENAEVGSIYSGSAQPLVLSKGTMIEGFIRAGGMVENPFSSRVSEGLIEGRPDPGSVYHFQVHFPELSENVRARSRETLTLVPGPYARATVDDSSTLRMSAGTYYFGSLEIRGGSLELDQSHGQIYIWVRDSMTLDGPILPAEELNKVLFGYSGTRSVELTSEFRGLLIAPAATVDLRHSGVYYGAVFANTINVEAGTVLRHITFDPF
jgi:hypothetical protein